MSSLLYGLGLSQFLWPNHYALFDFFISRCRQLSQVSSYLEVGPGHGLFLLEALRIFQDVEAMAIDISPTAIHISQSAVETLLPRSKCRFLIQDINQLEYGTYDLICMCELLEHLDDPIPVLRKALSLLAPQGHCFITTCANAPAIDHVYLYDSVEAIQSQLIDCGFRIEVELALPVESIPRERWSSEKTEVNYGALLSKQI
jgi:SAM-dependent methyltransferase